MTLEPPLPPFTAHSPPITAHYGRETARPHCPRPAPDAHGTAPPPRVPLERRSSPFVARATRPHGRAANQPAALPTPSSRRHPTSPRQLPPVPPSPVDEGVARSSHRARGDRKRQNRANERSQTPPGPIRRLHPTVAPEPAREGWWCSLLSRRRSRSAAHAAKHSSQEPQHSRRTSESAKAALRKARV